MRKIQASLFLALVLTTGLTLAQTSAPTQAITLPHPPQVLASTPIASCEWVNVIGSFAWPTGIFAMLLLVMFSSRLQYLFSKILKIFGRVSKVKGWSLELEFSPKGARELKESINEHLVDYIAAAKSEYDRLARAHDLNRLLTLAIDKIKDELQETSNELVGLRATVHVPDVVFEGFLYQLLDYQPQQKIGRGRRWSERYGLIGRAWRMNNSLYTLEALGASETNEATVHELVRAWGMNRKEAEDIATGAGAPRQSCLCVILRVARKPVGLLYLDAPNKRVFKHVAKDPNKPKDMYVKAELEEFPEVKRLAIAVDDAVAELRGKGTYLEF